MSVKEYSKLPKTQALLEPRQQIVLFHIQDMGSPISLQRCSQYIRQPKPTGAEVSVLKLWVMTSTPALALIPGPLWPGLDVLVRVLSIGQIKLFNNLLYLKLCNYMQTSVC